MAKKKKDAYAVAADRSKGRIKLPTLDYLPQRPRKYRPRIGMIGCGGISARHLQAYRKARYQVVAFTDLIAQRARNRRDEYYPRADVEKSAAALLARDDIDVVDIATHPAERAPLIEQAIKAGKHVLSQKPFVIDLAVGKRLCDLADRHRVKLAVNQNGRWAPHVSWMRHAIAAGLIGKLSSVDTLIAWDHTWVKGTPFERIPHLVMYDFAIHWFDMLHCYTRGQKPLEVSAQVSPAADQSIRPPLLAQVMVRYAHAQASLVFRAAAIAGKTDRTLITGTRGTITSQGADLSTQKVTLSTPQGSASPRLRGKWFPDGFDGTMSELLCAIEQKRQPGNSGRDNLNSLALCFAAMQSADLGRAVKVGSAKRLKPAWLRYGK